MITWSALGSSNGIQFDIDVRQVWEFTFNGDTSTLADEEVRIEQNTEDPTLFRVIFRKMVERAVAEAWVRSHGGELSGTSVLFGLDALLGPR